MTRIYLAETNVDNFQSGHDALVERGIETRYLLSYHYFGKKDIDALVAKYFKGGSPRFFLDSGAWSAFTLGSPIKMAEYIAFIKRFGHHFDVYSNLDDMQAPERTWRNQMEMEDAGLHPLPAFHTGEDFRHLERYVDRYPYVAVGKMVPWLKCHKKLLPWLAKIFQIARGGPTVFHGFGATNWEIAKTVPWYSVDSSSWSAGVRFGECKVFDPRTAKFISLSLRDRVNWQKNARLVRALGFDPEPFCHDIRGKDARRLICGFNAVAYASSKTYLCQVHGDITIPERP